MQAAGFPDPVFSQGSLDGVSKAERPRPHGGADDGKGKEVNAGKASPRGSPCLSSGARDPVLSSDGPRLPCGVIGSWPDRRQGKATSHRMDHRSRHGEPCSHVVPILPGPLLPAPRPTGPLGAQSFPEAAARSPHTSRARPSLFLPALRSGPSAVPSCTP